MNTDSYFEIGSTHDVCQDYAISGMLNQNLSFAIITDGCTESHKVCGEVDFGARLVAYAARDSLFEMKNYFSGQMSDPLFFKDICREIREKTLRTLDPIKSRLRIHEMSCDCTLVIAVSDGNNAYAFMYGDGGIIVKLRNGTTIYDEISYLSSAPYYIGYTIDKPRNDGYRIVFGASPVIHSHYEIPVDFSGKIEDAKISHSQAMQINENIYDFSSFMYKDIVSISVTSDGAKSFQKTDASGVKEIHPINVVPRLIGFKNTNGSFLQRRMKRFKQECLAETTSHYDDLSIATIMA